MRNTWVLFLYLTWNFVLIEGNLISRDNLEDPIESFEPSLSDWLNDVRLFSDHNEEQKVLLEFYYLVKVLKAYRLPKSLGSVLLNDAIERITEKEVVERLEKVLRKERAYLEIFLIGAEGTTVDQLQAQLANDDRLLYPFLIRTLRKVLGLKKSSEILPLANKDDFLGALMLDMQREWQALRQAVKDLKGDRLEKTYTQDKVPYVHGVESQPNTIQWADVVEPDSSKEDLGRMEYFQPTLRDDKEKDDTLLHRPIGDREDAEYEDEDLKNITKVIDNELDNFLSLIEELADVEGLTDEFTQQERTQMAEAIKQSFISSGALDQQYFIDALRKVLETKELRDRKKVLRALEKHYGCYKAGILFALAIILLLLIGCVPVFVLTANNNLILLILLATLVLIGLATFAYFRWQRNRALAMRRTYEQQKFALTRVQQPAAVQKANGGTMAKQDTIYTTYGQNGTTKLTPAGPTTGTKPDSADDQENSTSQSQKHTTSPPRYSFI
ncbi:hypothetical protein ZHAS_00018392 [Anopheles sinensis]|uniref:Uncharacterized protein n=1 Tax=Anopheles sinensis TaxID=74873 RepID=A0A084WHP4_ANOSI|nr:hypothetical protein ZHAS_00018392 [Anopheles sinensis]